MSSVRPIVFAACILSLVTACSGGDSATPDTPATTTQRQRDSAIANSGLPGAPGVGKAMQAQDSQASRNAQLDSLANEP